jgi:thiamine pyrophosphokinase
VSSAQKESKIGNRAVKVDLIDNTLCFGRVATLLLISLLIISAMSVTESADTVVVPKPQGPEWRCVQPFCYLEPGAKPQAALIILNQDLIGINLKQLWDHTELHVCADGGANRLYKSFAHERDRCRYIPQFITGDLDSITSETRQYYEARGSVVIQQLTQYATDFDKALQVSRLYFHAGYIRHKLMDAHSINDYNGLSELEDTVLLNASVTLSAYILGGIGGRFDQTIGSIHQLYKMEKRYPHLTITFITDEDIIFLLQSGKNYIEYSLRKIWNTTDDVPVCGLLPLSNTTTILNTQGLKYDVHAWPSDMLHNVSSSNGVCGEAGFVVETTEPIVMNIVIDHHQVE